MPEYNNPINIRSEEVQSILTSVPNWLIRWGSVLILILLMGVISLSYFIKYPDVIESEIVITTLMPMERLDSNIEGKIEALMVENNSEVKAGDVIGVLKNSAKSKDVLTLAAILDTLRVNKLSFEFPLEKLPILNLGELSREYALFETNYQEYVLYQKFSPYSYKFLKDDITRKENEEQLVLLKKQVGFNNQTLLLKEKDWRRSKDLMSKGIISKSNHERTELDYLNARKGAELLKSSISKLEERMKLFSYELTEIQNEKIHHEIKLLKSTIQSYFQLKDALHLWNEKYLFRSSINGIVSFGEIWSLNQKVSAGSRMFTIIPENNTGFLGKVHAPIWNSGKIKIGQRVKINVENFPEYEFGYLEGEITMISLVPSSEGTYLIEVGLPKELVTNYGVVIDLNQEMIGQAGIVTQEMRLLERFFLKLKQAIDH